MRNLYENTYTVDGHDVAVLFMTLSYARGFKKGDDNMQRLNMNTLADYRSQTRDYMDIN